MRWPWRREQLEGRASEEATAAAMEAKRARRDFENLAHRVDDVADKLSKTRERNHFAAAVARAIRGV